MPDLIIIGTDGTRHRFPDGMDPQQAIQVVKNSELKKANDKPINEPTTWLGGAMKGANDYLTEVGRGAFEGAAHPQTAGDFLSLLLPSTFSMSGGSSVLRGMKAASETEPVGNRAVRGTVQAVRKGASVAGQAADAIPASSIYAPAKLPLKAVQKAGEALPSESRMLGVDRYKPNVSGVPDRGVPQGELPRSVAADVDPHLPNRSGYVPGAYNEEAHFGSRNTTGVEGNPPIELETAQDVLMRDALSKTEAAQPDHVPYGGVEVPYKVKKPRMAREVDNPFGKESDADIYDRATSSGGRFDNESEPVPLKTEEPSVTVTPDAPQKLKLSSTELAEGLRRYYGSRDGGRMFNPHDPAAGAEALKRMAPGPSRMPLVAEARINNMPQPQSLEDALRDIILKRGEQ